MATIAITMAGRGQRFLDAGYTKPKFQIQANGQSLFYWSLLSLKHFYTPENEFVFICLKEHNCKEFIEEECQSLGIYKFRYIEIDKVTKGQAETAYMACSGVVSLYTAFLVHNIDTYIEPESIQPWDIQSDGWIPCFEAPGDHWSFVSTKDDVVAEKVVEKKRISDNATVGIYFFSSFNLYKKAYFATYKKNDNSETVEEYIAPMYNWMIEKGLTVTIKKINPHSVHCMGTPEQLIQFQRQVQ